jgi:hypothetical protein
MSKRQQYFRRGVPIDDSEALDADGVLRPGCTMRVPLHMTDGKPNPLLSPLQREIATRRARVTDGNGDSGEFAFSRPGYRIMNDAAVRDAREAAHREYVDYITNAYKEPQRVRDQDTRTGEPGLVDHDEPTHFSRPRITDGTGNCSELAFSRPGWRMLADASVNDARETAYAEYLEDLTNAWRRGGGKRSPCRMLRRPWATMQCRSSI